MSIAIASRVAAACVFAAATTASPSAQWPAYPTPNVPRTADGRPNLLAPAPRASDGKPDLSGIWSNPGWREIGAGTGVSGTGGAPGTPSVLPRGPGLFFNIASGVAGGLPLQPWAAELLKQRMAGNSKDNPDAHCLPMGNMQLYTHPQPRKIIQTPALIVILYEGNAGIRQIFTDGRPLPRNDPQPWWFGYSTGRWMGDTLVVQTSGFRDGGWLDVNGSPLTDAATMTERFTRVNYGALDIEVTVDDPKAYTKPWTVTIRNEVMLDTELIEFVCLENEQSTKHFR
ncbi:MAG TPA: hypothetical protein VFO58_18940 [Vicinamibacterales bacterium]|nr:hypothetical protein [Vicinamibacterales bacterium]